MNTSHMNSGTVIYSKLTVICLAVELMTIVLNTNFVRTILIREFKT